MDPRLEALLTLCPPDNEHGKAIKKQIEDLLRSSQRHGTGVEVRKSGNDNVGVTNAGSYRAPRQAVAAATPYGQPVNQNAARPLYPNVSSLSPYPPSNTYSSPEKSINTDDALRYLDNPGQLTMDKLRSALSSLQEFECHQYKEHILFVFYRQEVNLSRAWALPTYNELDVNSSIQGLSDKLFECDSEVRRGDRLGRCERPARFSQPQANELYQELRRGASLEDTLPHLPYERGKVVKAL